MHDVVIIGAGLMGRWHLSTARSLGARVVAVVDPDQTAARRLAARAPGARATDDLESVLNLGGVQVAHVCTPVATHREVTLRLISSGVHAFVEKPITETAAEVGDLLRRAACVEVQICPVHQYAFQSAIEQAVSLSPVLGPLRRFDMNICSAGSDGSPERRDEIVADILPHPISILQRFRPGPPVDELAWSVHRSGPGDLLAVSRDDDLLISIFISLNIRPTCFEAKLQYERGVLEIDGFHGFAVRLAGDVSRAAKIAAPFTRSTRTFLSASANLAARAVRGENAYAGLRNLTRRFYASVASGEPAMKPISDHAIIAAARLRDLLRERMSEADATFAQG